VFVPPAVLTRGLWAWGGSGTTATLCGRLPLIAASAR